MNNLLLMSMLPASPSSAVLLLSEQEPPPDSFSDVEGSASEATRGRFALDSELFCCWLTYADRIEEEAASSVACKTVALPTDEEKTPLTASSAPFSLHFWSLFWFWTLIPSSIEETREALLWFLLSLASTFSWCNSYSSRLGYILDIRVSKLGSRLSDRFDTSFLRQVGHSLLPDLRAVMIHSCKKYTYHRCQVKIISIIINEDSLQLATVYRDKNRVWGRWRNSGGSK